MGTDVRLSHDISITNACLHVIELDPWGNIFVKLEQNVKFFFQQNI